LLEIARIVWKIARKDMDRPLIHDHALENYDKIGEGRNFYATKLTLELCVGTPKFLMWA
jgi:hypothetical protein